MLRSDLTAAFLGDEIFWGLLGGQRSRFLFGLPTNFDFLEARQHVNTHEWKWTRDESGRSNKEIKQNKNKVLFLNGFNLFNLISFLFIYFCNWSYSRGVLWFSYYVIDAY